MIHAVLALGLFGLYFPSALLKATPDSICPVLKAKQDFKMQWVSLTMNSIISSLV